MLKRLSELGYKVDPSGTVTINLGDGGILKASPTEILVMADEIIRGQRVQTKLDTAESVYLNVLNALDIPEELVAEIRARLRGKIADTQPKEIEEHAKLDDVKEEHKMLHQFVTAFVNSEAQENEFEAEEFSPFGFDTNSLPGILGQYGFDVENKGNTIRISITGETKTHEQQRTD